ncbi:Exopolyphosphatase protein [Salinisphaera shabanensis E1L3A]|uniref:Exopolyphosphatase protein n=1 Tax=Salinisphaera shabanensis E1L3A TaxID=1033802 RepID=U2G309_9GAMM|nr:Ppx/GppA phosphatase family protein [Salinisphaera shabanensis]ERJ20528.1 Exopolyphosphatase protein [Salinisphaera shabanensis E1L3A]
MNRKREKGGTKSAPQTVAAVDLGSNSFHMIVVRDDGGKLHVVDRLKESVCLAGGLSADRQLDGAAADRALACLERFGQRLQGLAPGHVRAVGTNTLRRARNADAFLAEASAALGHPVEVIYGAEEARLIYGGVIQDLGNDHPRRLVIDIGGGSTELIVGELARPELVESLSLGAVVQMQRFFANGKITRKAWQAAVTDARLTVEPVARAYRQAGWDLAIGASGSVKSILRAAGAKKTDETITPADLKSLARALLKAGKVDKLDLPGVSDERRAIFPGGLAVLTGLFESLGIEAMRVSDKALREGVVADLLGRLHDHDAREDGVLAASRRYDVDRGQAERVADTAIDLLGDYDDERATGMASRLLRWAALLHEIGLAISHKGYHKHGEYILRNADLEGFSRSDQAVLATLVRLHRGRFRSDLIDALPEDWRGLTYRLALVLRLAVILHRGRDPQIAPPAWLEVAQGEISLYCDADWLEERPLTQADLAREAELLARADIKLKTLPEA